MTSSETKIGLSPFANWYTNFISDVWSSPSFFQKSHSFILPLNCYFKVNVNGLLVYGARNCIIICQIHGSTIRYNSSVRVFPSIHEKVITIAFARCLKNPKLFIGSNQGNVLLYHIEKNAIQTMNCTDVKKSELSFSSLISAADWSDNVNVYYSKGCHIVQWDTQNNIYFSIELTSISESKARIDSIKLTKVDPLLLAVAFSGGKITILKLNGLSLLNYTVVGHLNYGSNEITSMAFPFSNGSYENGVLAAIARNGSLKVWELDSKKVLAEQHFATKSDKSKSTNFFSLTFIPRPSPAKSESSQLEKSNELTESDIIQTEDSDLIILDSPEKPDVKPDAESNKERESPRYFLKLLASRVDGKIVIIDVPADKRDVRMNALKRPELISVNRLTHHNVVFNISVVNPFHYIVNENGRSIQPFWNMDFFASSISLDRHIIIYDLKRMTSVRPMFPTVSLQVHDLDFYPADYTKLLIACGDGLKIWYFNHNATDLTKDGPANYRIDNVSNVPPSTKIVSASWHPHNKEGESLVGFGTDEGTFICVDLNKQVMVYSSEYKLTGIKTRVYSCKWGPIPSEFASTLTRNWACYTVYAAGSVRAHIVTDSKAFNLDELSDSSIARGDISKTECVWKDDYCYVAIGYEDGQIIICVNDGHFKPAIILDIHTSLVSCIRWHPDNLYQFVNKSKTSVVCKDKAKYNSWIASSSKDITVKLTDLKMFLVAYQESKQVVYVNQSTRSLEGHQDGVISIAWNRVSEELLASCSADTTVQVWHVDLEVPLHTFRGHWSRVFAVVWAPWDGNLIFSAGDDSTVQVWSPGGTAINRPPTIVNNLQDIDRIDSPVPEINEPSPRKGETNSIKEPAKFDDDEQYSALTSSGEHEINQVLDSSAEVIINFPVGQIVKHITEASSESTGTPKVSPDDKKPAGNRQTSQSPGPSNRRTGQSPGSSNRSDAILNRLKNADKTMPEITYKDKKRSLLPKSNIVENCSTKFQTLQDVEFLLSKRYNMSGFDINDNELRRRNLIFLDKDEIGELCSAEISNHKQNKNVTLAHQISALQGNLKEMITEAVKTSQLTDWMVSQAASISREFWSKTVLAYAIQLEKSGDSLQSALYYSTIHRIIDAARVLVKAGLFKEALILVKSRETYNTQLVKDILDAWAGVKRNDNNYEFAAKIYLANMSPIEASKCLGERSDDPKCQQLKRTIDLAEALKLDDEVDPDPPVNQISQ